LVEVDVDVELVDDDEDVDVEVDPPVPPAVLVLGTAVHLFPPIVVMNCPAGRLALVDMMSNV
jgi:hypothetical protein